MTVIGHMVVGPGEAERYLSQVLERATWWADHLHVTVDARAGQDEWEIVNLWADSYDRSSLTWADHEGKFRESAWRSMEAAAHPQQGDHIVLLDADEVVIQHEMIKKMAGTGVAHRFAFTFHEMWSASTYRIDRLWKPYLGHVMVPYYRGGHFRDRPIACGREPTYATSLPALHKPIADILHYGYARPQDRQDKYDRYMDLDAGKYHSLEHLKSILYPASTKEWEKGGLLWVP